MVSNIGKGFLAGLTATVVLSALMVVKSMIGVGSQFGDRPETNPALPGIIIGTVG